MSINLAYNNIHCQHIAQKHIKQADPTGSAILPETMKGCLLFAAACLAYSLAFDDGTNHNFPEIIAWLNSHHPIEIDTISELDAKQMFKAGSVKVHDTNTIIMPDGDFVDISSFYDIKGHHGKHYQFAEYDFSQVLLYRETVEKLLGTGLDNSKSSVTNSMSYSIGVSQTITKGYSKSISSSLLAGLSGGFELDIARGLSISEQVTCKALPGQVTTVYAIAHVVKVGNIQKRPVIITAHKNLKDCVKGLLKGRLYGCLKHDYSYEKGEWVSTEFEYVKTCEVECR